ncbi:hypothetical protein C0Q70_08349 [Pomacea canaliculata]|uniref:Uncharacterized protein n=1 Tax=Pomacea canaliculata TaxID=400727 RepID=A0A2T7PHK9_POMCA|nr:hypothetical protein C0Q70_08349 [Pomacea canaliculata]
MYTMSGVVFFTVIVDFLDLVNGLHSLNQISKKTSPNDVPALHCCGCICLLFSVCCLLLTMFNVLEICDCSCIPRIDTLSGLTVWFGDMPQAFHNARFSKSHLDPRTLFGWPDAAAVLTDDQGHNFIFTDWRIAELLFQQTPIGQRQQLQVQILIVRQATTHNLDELQTASALASQAPACCAQGAALPIPIIDGVYCLVVWVGDLPQACLDVYFSKDPSLWQGLGCYLADVLVQAVGQAQARNASTSEFCEQEAHAHSMYHVFKVFLSEGVF